MVGITWDHHGVGSWGSMGQAKGMPEFVFGDANPIVRRHIVVSQSVGVDMRDGTLGLTGFIFITIVAHIIGFGEAEFLLIRVAIVM